MQEGKQGKQGGEPNQPLGFEEILEIAEAMSARETKEMEAAPSEIPENLPEGVTEVRLPEDVRANMQTARTAMLIQKLEDPTSKPDIEQISKGLSMSSYSQIAETANEQFDGELQLEGEDAKDMILSFAKVMEEERAGEDGEAEEAFVRQFEAAKTVAKRNGTTIAEVYRQDELYAEMFRTAYTPEELIAQNLKAMKVISDKTLNAFLIKAMETIMPEDIKEGMSEEEISELMAGIQMNPMAKMVINGMVEMMRSNIKTNLMNKVIKFWGEEVLDDLPKDLKIELGLIAEEGEETLIDLQLGNTAIVGFDPEQMELQQRRKEFVENYFATRGWDPDNPTTEQVLEVRSQPGWIDPEA